MAQQTAMQALWEWIDANYHEDNFNLNDARDVSLELEKQQIMNAHNQGYEDGYRDNGNSPIDYYNETFNNNEQQ